MLTNNLKLFAIKVVNVSRIKFGAYHRENLTVQSRMELGDKFTLILKAAEVSFPSLEV